MHNLNYKIALINIEKLQPRKFNLDCTHQRSSNYLLSKRWNEYSSIRIKIGQILEALCKSNCVHYRVSKWSSEGPFPVWLRYWRYRLLLQLQSPSVNWYSTVNNSFHVDQNFYLFYSMPLPLLFLYKLQLIKVK